MKDISSYQIPDSYNRNAYGSAKLRVFFKLNTRISQEVYAGLSFRYMDLGRVRLQKLALSKSVSYYNSQNGESITEMTSIYENKNFSIEGFNIQLPFGYQLTTKQTKLLWFNFGFELAPGLLTYKNYFSNAYSSENTRIFKESSSAQVQEFYGSNFNVVYLSSYSTKAKGSNFTLNTALPVGVNFRCSNKNNFFKRLHFCYEFSYGIEYIAAKEIDAKINPFYNSMFGLRYHLN